LITAASADVAGVRIVPANANAATISALLGRRNITTPLKTGARQLVEQSFFPWRRPAADPVATWLEASEKVDVGHNLELQLTSGHLWARGFDFTLALRHDDNLNFLSLEGLAADTEQGGWLRIDVDYRSQNCDKMPDRRPHCVPTGASAGRRWIQADFWVYPRPEPSDVVIVSISIEPLEVTWSTTWQGSVFDL